MTQFYFFTALHIVNINGEKRKDGDKMTQTRLLQNMFLKLSESLQNEKPPLYKNYEQQLALYEELFEAPAASAAERERALISARCIIALSRSLVGNVPDESLDAAKRELEILKPLFTQTKRQPEKSKIKELVMQRIDILSPSRSDEIVDAVLFLYLSLVPIAK
ncbi:MAG: hypothetical protein UHH95_00155 [Oscillospiraceae bacterium]|nr:hypothetical protein [Oscillospiraceae bacterium]